MPEPVKRQLQYSSLEELKSMAETQVPKKYMNTPKMLKNTMEKLYYEALKSENDPERSYILLTRCMETFVLFRRSTSDFEEDMKYHKHMIGEIINNTMKRLERLSEELEQLYNERKLVEQQSKALKELEETRTIPQPQLNQNGSHVAIVNGISGDIIRNEKTSISCKELFDLAIINTTNTVLIIDVRSKEDFLNSSIKIGTADIINVPENMIEPSLIPSKLETKLEEQFQVYFKRRGDYKRVVVLDWFSTENSLQNDKKSSIYLMMSKLKNYDVKTKYKNKPVILNGGYEEWLSRYPTYTTKSNVTLPKKEINSNRTLIDTILYPSASLLEPDFEAKKPITVSPPETIAKPTIDRSTKPVLPEKKTEPIENGVAPEEIKKSLESNDNDKIISTTKEEPISKIKRESIEEDEEELKKQCIRSGRRSALTSISNQPLTVDDAISDSDDIDDTKNEEQENRMNSMKSGKINFQNESGSGMKRYSSTPNISKIENEYSRPPIDRSTKPSNDDQINIFTKNGMYTEEEGRGLTGLLNVGNTCYMNSILQCLSNTEPFRKLMCNLSSNFTNKNSKTEGLIAREVGNIIKQLWMRDSGPISCKTLKNIVGRYRDTFRGSEQQDSHEFLTILIDWMHEDLNEPMMERCLKGADEKSGEKAWGEFTSKNNSEIRHLFYGQQKSTVSCNTCEKESVTFEPFSNLSLPLPSAEKCTLAECLKLYTSNEHISGWQCPGCKTSRSATKKLDITKLPPLLVIHFKRFTSDGWCRKRLTNVDFPSLLDMTPYIIGQEHRNRRYELYAVSNHMGTMETGHYTAYCRNSVNGRWYKFDDDSVTSINNVTKSSSAYIVFYKSY